LIARSLSREVLFKSLRIAIAFHAATAQVGPAQPALSPPPRAQIVQVTPIPGPYTEPSIAVDPNNPQQLLAAYQVNASIVYSRDGGQRWALAEGTAPAD